MNLEYRILWVEDDESFIESQAQTLEKLKTHIQDEGFDITFDFKTSPSQIDIAVVGYDFDLIVIDYNLTEDGENGDDVIKAVRDHNFLTEVIFYSGKASGTLRQKAAEKQLDGVFFSTKDADALFAKILSVFELTVRKVVDVNNMRGIVMAAIADIDHQLSDILTILHDKLQDAEKIKHRKKLYGKMLPNIANVRKLTDNDQHEAISALEATLDELKKLEPKDFLTLVGHHGFDSYKRVGAVESFCKAGGPLDGFKEKIESIKGLLKWRNALAHQKPTVKAKIAYFELNEGELVAFDAPNGRALRKSLREHRLHLANAHSTVSQEQ
ncbi:hypothetical protein ASC94_30900 [Massilia sp. Root418]|uniref:response regulator n=1 Tax=Massilia sp. Root418 TaxID=1736532 RepID=UPI00070238DA|nr:response regulator [Massilia sp. Root418]KQW99942.1 hypothetical protein ASC94_30900 [Massilia sp. Root418]